MWDYQFARDNPVYFAHLFVSYLKVSFQWSLASEKVQFMLTRRACWCHDLGWEYLGKHSHVGCICIIAPALVRSTNITFHALHFIVLIAVRTALI